MEFLCVSAVVILILLMLTACSNHPAPPENPDPGPGVSAALAEQRARTISSLSYDLLFTIPADPAQPVSGHETIRFATKDISHPIVLDFTPDADHIESITIGGRPSQYRTVRDHIIIPPAEIGSEDNVVDIHFRAGDASLNRTPEFMYTLFVPARAHLAFPCFDQPDLKARFALELNAPAAWQAVANGAETYRETSGDRLRIRFAETQPIPTYLFAFAAGKFQIETEERNGRWYRMFHRETDRSKIERNKKAIFDLHASALDWLEKYTSIPYRFGKFDFVLIPSFQFSGMEHPGAIFYNASSILLEQSATENQLLNRATTIAHETSHMWFGDLVTMRWFNDVWMKEVFANFMAAKIVNPAFPHVNHDLRFFASNYPAAYDVDRTSGSHAIRQDLENLDEAGSLYDEIIYNKAPVVMRQLERILGPDKFQAGIRAYLKQFQFGNAAWPDLIDILDQQTDADLKSWSRAWVDEAGRPSIQTIIQNDRVEFVQSDPMQSRALLWPQRMDVMIGKNGNMVTLPVDFQAARAGLTLPSGFSKPDWILPAGGGLAYGDFTLDDATRRFFLQQLETVHDALTRGAAWTTLFEEMLDGRVQPPEFLGLVIRALPVEDTEQNVQLVLSYSAEAYWTFLQDSDRARLAPGLEQMLLSGIRNAPSQTTKATYFAAFRSMATTAQGVAFLESIWRRDEKIPGLTLGEQDEAAMALDLAVRSAPDADGILQQQLARFTNPDRKARFEFEIPALSESQQTRDDWFENLKQVQNRRREPWVLEGLSYLHHPIRAAQSEKYIQPSLELLIEIQRTGDIFFPGRWMNATLAGRNSRSAAGAVRQFLDAQKNYPMRLRRIILQAADELFRAADRTGS